MRHLKGRVPCRRGPLREPTRARLTTDAPAAINQRTPRAALLPCTDSPEQSTRLATGPCAHKATHPRARQARALALRRPGAIYNTRVTSKTRGDALRPQRRPTRRANGNHARGGRPHGGVAMETEHPNNARLRPGNGPMPLSDHRALGAGTSRQEDPKHTRDKTRRPNLRS